MLDWRQTTTHLDEVPTLEKAHFDVPLVALEARVVDAEEECVAEGELARTKLFADSAKDCVSMSLGK
jgi:hypothetical protein